MRMIFTRDDSSDVTGRSSQSPLRVVLVLLGNAKSNGVS